jgi:two-component system response regulator HydG
VDDDVTAVDLRRAILERAGHQVDVSTSAHAAIEKLGLLAYDAIVTDWRLGGASARGVIHAAKRESEVPVVVVSGFVEEAFQAAEPMADLYLDKPVDPAELTTILDVLLRDKRIPG